MLHIVGGEAVFTIPFAVPSGSCFLSTEVGSHCGQLQNTEGAGLGVPEGGMVKKPNFPSQPPSFERSIFPPLSSPAFRCPS